MPLWPLAFLKPAWAFMKGLSLSTWIAVALVAALAVQTARIEGFKVWPVSIDGYKAELAEAKAALAVEKKARADDRKAYQDAQAKAAADMRAENQRIEADQRRISDEAQSRYERDLAHLRAVGVRKDLAAPPSPSGKGGATGVPEATCTADGQNVLVDRAIILRAAEIELKANALIDWVNEQEAASHAK